VPRRFRSWRKDPIFDRTGQNCDIFIEEKTRIRDNIASCEEIDQSTQEGEVAAG